MIRVSCSVKTHSFQLAEQIERAGLLSKLYTIYHSEKDTFTARFNKRKDFEKIALHHVKTFPFLAPLSRLRKDPFANNAIFDGLVSADLKRDPDYELFIGWSGMSFKSLTQAKRDGKKGIIERGSSHIRFQFSLLHEEFARWGYRFGGDDRVAKQEEAEYELADYVVVPSSFVANTFIDKGISPKKIFTNNFGSTSFFNPTAPKRDKFTILYVGNLSIRKGLPYLFEAIRKLAIDPAMYDVWFVGSIADEIRDLIPKYERPNWKFFGHVPFLDLPDVISQCSVAVHPSLEEGLSMVIPQLMACGTPVIATTNTGGEDIIQDSVSGYIVPIRSAESIAAKITTLYEDSNLLASMREHGLSFARKTGTWDQYGDRYMQFIKSIQIS